MKLFFDTVAMLNYPCGIAVYIKSLLNEFAAYPDLELHTGFKSINLKQHAKLKNKLREHVDNSLSYHPVYLPGRFPLHGIQKIFAPSTYDVAHFTANIAPPYLPSCDFSKTIITIHDMFLWYDYFNHVNGALENYILNHLQEQASECAAITTVSEFSKKEIIRYLGIPAEKIHVIPNGTQWRVEIPEFCNILSDNGISEKRYFLSVSSLAVHKNFPNLCKAFSAYRASADYAGEKLVIVGSRRGGDEEIYSAIKSTPDVIHIPRVSEEELRYLYAKAKGFFLVSKLEGFGIPLLEAMSSHTPACYGKGNSMDEIGRDAAVGVDPDDIDGIADVFRYFSAAPEDLQRRVEAAYQISQEYTWENTAEKHFEVYRKVCKSV